MNNINIINKTTCTGCTACLSVCNKFAISMVASSKGFVYPKVDEEICVNCGRCVKVCPTNGFIKQKDISPLVYAVVHNNNDVLTNSSSGGLFTAISDYVLSEGGVVYGAVQDSNVQTFHNRAATVDERNRQRGSKYVQSELKNTIGEAIRDLKDHRLVLFTGTPCQIAGISNAIGSSPLRANLILMDIICNGATSPLIFQEYLNYCEKKFGSKVIAHYHRPKDFGWGHNEKNVFANGKIDNTSDYSKAWKKIFYSGNPLRDCCYNCPFASMDRVSDFTIGDFWGIQNTKISLPTEHGVSLCIINSAKGASLFDKFSKSMQVEEAKLEDAIVKQPRLRGICANPENKDKFWSDYFKKGAKYTIEKYGECTPFIVLKHHFKDILIKAHLWR